MDQFHFPFARSALNSVKVSVRNIEFDDKDFNVPINVGILANGTLLLGDERFKEFGNWTSTRLDVVSERG